MIFLFEDSSYMRSFWQFPFVPIVLFPVQKVSCHVSSSLNLAFFWIYALLDYSSFFSLLGFPPLSLSAPFLYFQPTL